MRTIAVQGSPRLAPLLVRAALTARGRGGPLPDTRVEHHGVVVDRGRLAAYQRLCGYVVRDALPSTYLHVLSFGLQATLMAERGFPLPLPGLVHVANSLVLHRVVDACEPLSYLVRAERLRDHPRGRQVDLVSTASVAGEEVWSGRSTYLARSDAASSSSRPELASGAAGPDGPAGPEGPDDLPVLGTDGPPTARWRVPADIGRRYAAVSGDVNPIHLAAPAARAFGFPRAIAHGMWTAARCLASLEPWSPPAHEVRIVFRRPVLLPSTVELRTRPHDGGWLLGLSSRSGTEHLRGTVRPL
ncbi:MAG TPA: MaoC family dehydratase [Actinomycetales bacterium]|nr:MaoC family dehydratase [Actinomycetales bacterium]